MKLFKKKELTRRQLLDKASKVRGKRKGKKAIAIYREILKKEPEDFELHLKMAPILASMGDFREALSSFKKAAEGYHKKGKTEKTIAIYKQAARIMPTHIGLWERIARLELDRKKTPDALSVLLEGSKHFHKKANRDKCIRLLRIAFKIKPWHFTTTIELSKQLARARQAGEAKKILAQLSDRVETHKQLRKVRRTQFGISPGPVTFWLLIKSLFGK